MVSISTNRKAMGLVKDSLRWMSKKLGAIILEASSMLCYWFMFSRCDGLDSSHGVRWWLGLVPVGLIYDIIFGFPYPRVANNAVALSVCHSIILGSLEIVLFHSLTVRIAKAKIVLCIWISQVTGYFKIICSCGNVFGNLI
jgi:hypothetical protein